METKFPAGKRGYRSGLLAGVLGAALSAIVAAGPAWAGEAVQLKSGRLLVGEVKQYDGKTVEIQLDTGGMTRIPVDQLAPTWRYRLHVAHFPPTTAEMHEKLGAFCARHALYAQAREHYKLAAELDKARKDKIELRMLELDERIAGALFARLTSALKRRKFDKAKEALDTLTRRYPASAPAQWAADLRPAIIEGLAAARRVQPDEEVEKELKREVALQKKIKRITAEVDRTIAAARELHRKAMAFEGDDSQSRAMRAFELASEHYEKSIKMLEALERKATDRETTRALFERRQKVVHRWVLLAESAAHLRSRQGNFKDAHRWVMIARRMEPLNERIKKLYELIDEHRITRKLSKMTNVKPVVRSQ